VTAMRPILVRLHAVSYSLWLLGQCSREQSAISRTTPAQGSSAPFAGNGSHNKHASPPKNVNTFSLHADVNIGFSHTKRTSRFRSLYGVFRDEKGNGG
jgi:hypothetical protein